MAIAPDTSPATIRESILRVVGVEATLQVCALVRDEILRRAQVSASLASGTPHHIPPPLAPQPPPPTDPNLLPAGGSDTSMYGAEEDPEVVLQNALRQLQQEEADAEATAAAAREEREQRERAQGTAAAALATPMHRHISAAPSAHARFTPIHGHDGDDLNLTPIKSDEPVSTVDRPVRCPFCVNHRMLRTIKEAVEHMSTHVIV
ncbi:hypothetical protein F5X68DRAFT_209594 [Plectosphaerella plurivora]|uniref:Uncharacterized protein n=1 Tax=Plectosphaerella plurivora TaxID=936078 RepID=A0A9P8VAZ8_9PEZI|nr:hypothetical protein F5X68DRAFT_209594 [Plectosphaerella plurivora]